MQSGRPINLDQTIYERLHARHIRILRVQAGSRPEPVEADLETVSIDNSNIYEALSYTWDDQVPSVPITCNGSPLLITQNVSHALLELRSTSDARTIWIDQVCINQQDNIERAAQVALIRDIYANAQQTVIWLGNATKNTALAFEVLERLADVKQCGLSKQDVGFVLTANDTEATVKRHCEAQPERIRQVLSALPLVKSTEFASYLDLLSRAWFGRLWIVQEAILASSQSEYRCGQYRCNIERFNAAMQAFSLCGYASVLTWKTPAFIGDWISNVISDVRYSRRQGKDFRTISNLLRSTAVSNCKDPRDRIYALLGLCDQKMLQHVVVDYTKSVAEIYSNVVKATIIVDQSMEIFGAVQRWDETPIDLPSWTPDFAEQRNCYGLDLGMRNRQGMRLYNVSRRTSPQMVPTDNIRQIALRGIQFRRISRQINDSIAIRDYNTLTDVAPYDYASWCERYRAEAARLRIPQSCIRDPDSTHNTSSDILYYKSPITDASDEIMLAITLRRVMTADTYPRTHESRLKKWQWHDRFPRMHQWARAGCTPDIPYEVLREHENYVSEVMRSRTMYVAEDEPEDAYICLASVDVKVGDWICIMFGADVPFVLRPGNNDAASLTDQSSIWEFICECYVHGIMDGEAFDTAKQPLAERVVILE